MYLNDDVAWLSLGSVGPQAAVWRERSSHFGMGGDVLLQKHRTRQKMPVA